MTFELNMFYGIENFSYNVIIFFLIILQLKLVYESYDPMKLWDS